MAELVILGLVPSVDLAEAIHAAAEVLDIWECWSHDGRYHFALGGKWSLAISADSANRIRVDACRLTRPESTMWSPAHRRDRLAGLVRRMSTVPEAA